MSQIVNVGNVKSNDYSDSRQPIRIRRNDRVLFVGKTGCGKTTTATILLAPLPFLVVLDPKHQFEWSTNVMKLSPRLSNQTLTTHRLSEAIKWESSYPIIYRPSRTECKTGCEAFWEWINWRENCIVFVDDVIGVCPTVNMPDGYLQAVQMGRGKNIGVWSATQRPARIPQNLISEAEHVFVFELSNPIDLKRVAEFTDPIILRERAYKHDCWYYGTREGKPRYMNAENIVVKVKR